nr:hypothetical protein HmN_000309900 [Hymenolepis microstoma]
MIYNKAAREEFEQVEHLVNTKLNGIFIVKEINEATIETDYPYIPVLWTAIGVQGIFKDEVDRSFTKQLFDLIDTYSQTLGIKLPEEITHFNGKYCVNLAERINQVIKDAQLSDLQNKFSVYIEEHSNALIKYVDNNINWNYLTDEEFIKAYEGRLELFKSCVTKQAQIMEERLSAAFQEFSPFDRLSLIHEGWMKNVAVISWKIITRITVFTEVNILSSVEF